MKAAEKRCGTKPKQYEWSPTLRKFGKHITLLKAIKSKLNYSHIRTKQIIELLEKDEIVFSPPITKQKINKELKKAILKYKSIKKQAKDLRMQHLEERAQYHESISNKKAATILKQIIQSENTQNLFRKIRYVKSANQPGRVFKVTKSNQSGDTELITDAKEVQDLILQENEGIFTLGNGTFPTTEEYTKYIGTCGQSFGVNEILEGRTNREYLQVDNLRWELIQQLERARTGTGEPTKEISPEIKVEEFENLMKKTKEETASSPSNIHMGHYIVCALSPILSEIIVKSINIPFKQGFTMPRWNSSIHHMLEKSPGNHSLKKMRIIQLVEADFNIYQKIKISRELMRKIVKEETFPDEMYGGRKNRTSHDAISAQTLMFDLARQQERTMVCLNLDAEKCYDRIFPSYASIALTRLGLPRSVSISLAKTQRFMEHRVRTRDGISDKNITRKENTIWNGLGQGWAAAVPAWLAVEGPMLNVIKTKLDPMEYSSPDSTISTSYTAIGYVDDNNLNFPVPKYWNKNEIKNEIKKAVSIWDHMLETSGGSLSPTKCFAHIAKGTSHLSRNSTMNGAFFSQPFITHVNTQGQVKSIKEAPDHDGMRYLGVRICPKGTMNKEFEYRMECAKNFGKTLEKNSLSRVETEIYHDKIWIPSLTYCLHHTTFTYHQCKELQKQYMPNILAKLGYNRHISRDIVHSPKEVGGLGIAPIYVLQGVAQIDKILHHFRKQDKIAKLLAISLQYAQLEYGTGECILNSSEFHEDDIKDTWVKSVAVFLQYCSSSIDLPSKIIFYKQRKNDEFIMNTDKADLLKSAYQEINDCRIWLRAMTISDITTQDGIKIEKWALRGLKQCPSVYKWQDITYPSSKAWKSWRRFISRTYMLDNQLMQPMQEWLNVKPHIRHQHIYNPTTRKIITINEQNTITTYSQYTTYQFKADPPGLVRADYVGIPIKAKNIDSEYVFCKERLPYKHIPQKKVNDLKSAIKNLSIEEQSMIAGCHLPTDEGTEIVNQLSQNEADLGSDGSVKTIGLRDSCSFGYTIQGTTEETSMYGANICSPISGKPSSLRAELYGILASIICLKVICQYHKIKNKVDDTSCFSAYVDNMEAIKRMKKERSKEVSRKAYLRPEYNIEQTILDLTEQLPIQGGWQWVKAHTDLETTPHKINRKTDLLAGQAHTTCTTYSDMQATNQPLIKINQRICSSNEGYNL